MYKLNIPIARIKQLARIFLRRVHDSEQTRELHGISSATGVEMFLLVAFNVLLDVLMGCTSGGVRIRSESNTGKMVHFRTLDWGMDALRKVVVCLEFVEEEDGPVIARTVTYVGFVGVLTGVRQGMSVSLNFRGLHNHSDSPWSNCMYFGHQMMVMLGFRPSIASVLRKMVIPTTSTDTWKPSWEYLENKVSQLTTTSCYLVFCSGQETLVLEKDRVTGAVRTSKTFVSATNHDLEHEDESILEALEIQKAKADVTGMADIITESVDRKGCLETCFQDAVSHKSSANGDIMVDMSDVESWLGTYPVLNECTHYAVIMDPENGEISWARRWEKPYRPRK
jgi:hypothetical protein